MHLIYRRTKLFLLELFIMGCFIIMGMIAIGR